MITLIEQFLCLFAGYNPNQERDEKGRWVKGSGVAPKEKKPKSAPKPKATPKPKGVPKSKGAAKGSGGGGGGGEGTTKTTSKTKPKATPKPKTETKPKEAKVRRGGGKPTEGGVRGMGRIDPHEVGAIKEYSGSAYKEINGFHRGTHALAQHEYKNHADRKKVEEYTKQLDAAFSKTLLAHNATVYRWVDMKAFGGNPPAIGSTLIDNGYLSTSRGADITKHFGNSMLEIRAKKGMSALDMSLHSQYPEEQELLFPRGTKLKVRGVRTTSDGKHVITVDMVKGRKRAN